MVAADWISITGIIVAPIIGFIVWLVAISNRVGKLETKVEVFWKAVSIDAAKILHSPHPGRERLDQLIDKYVSETIVQEEIIEMKWYLHDIKNDTEIPCSERLLASMLLRILDLRIGTYKKRDA